jgi:hypothetical protein
MNIPANPRVVKGSSPRFERPAGTLVRAVPVTCLMLVGTRSVHLVTMAFSSAPDRVMRLFPVRQPWPRQVFASSLAVHALGFALVGWATHGKFGTAFPPSPQQVSRAYAVRYLALNSLPVRPAARSERRPPMRSAPVTRVRPSATLPSDRSVVESASQSAPPSAPQTASLRTPRTVSRPPTLEAEALAPGATAGIGEIVPTPHSDSTGGRGLAGMLGFRGPTTAVEPARHGLDRLPELVGGTGSACPEPRPSGAGAGRQSAVAVTFVVDTNGRVDRATLQVIESPSQPRTDHRFHARIYVVGASLRGDHGRIPPTASDSVLTEAVASHVAGLVFRPAMREDRVIRSTVLVSCQTF